MLRHKSTPCLVWATTGSINSSRPRSTTNRGDELEDRYHDLQDQHLQLKQEANMAQCQIKMLNTRLSRLLNEKKKYYRNVRTEREIQMEDKLFHLERLLERQQQQNERLKQRLELMRTLVDKSERTGGHNQHHHTTLTTTMTTTTRQISSAYAHVRSRVDSGLSITSITNNKAPSNKTTRRRARSQTDLRDRTVKFQDDQPDTAIHSIKDDFEDNHHLSQSATELMQEAKEEIIRLESVVRQQQQVIDSLAVSDALYDDSTSDQPSPVSNITMVHASSPELLPTSNLHQEQSPLCTMMTAANSTNENDQKQGENSAHSSILKANTTIDDLWQRYQQIIMHKESFRKVSHECQLLIERLYKAVKYERQQCQLIKERFLTASNQLALQQQQQKPTTDSTVLSVILEKDKIIETLRKENKILQTSLKECMDQVVMGVTGDDSLVKMTSTDARMLFKGHYDSTGEQLWKEHKTKYEQQIKLLDKQMKMLNEDLREQRSQYDQLCVRYEHLKELNDTDQLKIGYLEQKCQRLSSKILNQQKQEQNQQNGHYEIMLNGNPDDNDQYDELSRILNYFKIN